MKKNIFYFTVICFLSSNFSFLSCRHNLKNFNRPSTPQYQSNLKKLRMIQSLPNMEQTNIGINELSSIITSLNKILIKKPQKIIEKYWNENLNENNYRKIFSSLEKDLINLFELATKKNTKIIKNNLIRLLILINAIKENLIIENQQEMLILITLKINNIIKYIEQLYNSNYAIKMFFGGTLKILHSKFIKNYKSYLADFKFKIHIIFDDSKGLFDISLFKNHNSNICTDSEEFSSYSSDSE